MELKTSLAPDLLSFYIDFLKKQTERSCILRSGGVEISHIRENDLLQTEAELELSAGIFDYHG